jgi:hypothetical protein
MLTRMALMSLFFLLTAKLCLRDLRPNPAVPRTPMYQRLRSLPVVLLRRAPTSSPHHSVSGAPDYEELKESILSRHQDGIT